MAKYPFDVRFLQTVI